LNTRSSTSSTAKRTVKQAAQAVRRALTPRVTNAPITLSEEDGVRYLHFGSPWIQGAMRIRKPFALEIEYTRDMMAWQEHIQAPAHIVQLGLGAGSLTKYCYQRCPQARVTAVEINPAVVVCCRQFFKLPPDDARLQVVIEDAALWVRQPRNANSCDVLQVDLYDALARGPVHDSQAFYTACRKTLVPGGIMTVNVFGNGAGFEDSYAAIAAAFKGQCYALAQVEAGNRVVVAMR
jgi:spermidine synthase